jgi:hypothetical protein
MMKNYHVQVDKQKDEKNGSVVEYMRHNEDPEGMEG